MGEGQNYLSLLHCLQQPQNLTKNIILRGWTQQTSQFIRDFLITTAVIFLQK